MNNTDLAIINFLHEKMHQYIPFTNDYIFGFEFGEYAFLCLLVYVAGEIYLIKTGNWNKGAKK